MKSIRLMTLCALGCLLSGAAHAQLTVSLTPSSTNPLQPGQTLSYSGTVTNTSGAEVFLNGDEILLHPTDAFVIDDTPFLTMAPLSLQPGDAYTGALFNLTAPSDPVSHSYSGTFTIFGGPDSFTTDPVGVEAFRFQAVPEPGAMALLGGVVVSGIGFMLRRRRRR